MERMQNELLNTECVFEPFYSIHRFFSDIVGNSPCSEAMGKMGSVGLIFQLLDAVEILLLC